MATCDECGEYENLPYQCHRCGRTFCSDHRLPESHDCPGLHQWDDPGGVFDSGFDDSVENRGGGSSNPASRVGERVRRRVGRETSTGGAVGYFRNNLTFAFLGLMWVTFLLQYLLFPLAGFGPRTELWASVFVLRPDRLEFAWTYLTSIFAHGGITHIVFNSIVLYFFGPPVERRLGSKRFFLLFLGAGALAGLGQFALTAGAAELGLAELPAARRGVLGASGAIMAVLGVLTVLNPKLRVYLWFVLPLPLWVLTVGIVGFSVLFGFGGAADGVAHLAHLVGVLIGLAYGARVADDAGRPRQLRLGGGPGGPGRGRF